MNLQGKVFAAKTDPHSPVRLGRGYFEIIRYAEEHLLISGWLATTCVATGSV